MNITMSVKIEREDTDGLCSGKCGFLDKDRGWCWLFHTPAMDDAPALCFEAVKDYRFSLITRHLSLWDHIIHGLKREPVQPLDVSYAQFFISYPELPYNRCFLCQMVADGLTAAVTKRTCALDDNDPRWLRECPLGR